MQVSVPAFEYQVTKLKSQLVKVEAAIARDTASLIADRRNWLEKAGSLARRGKVWRVLSVEQARSNGGTLFEHMDDASVLAYGPIPLNDVHTFTSVFQGGTLTAVRLETLRHESFKNNGFAPSFNGDFLLSRIRFEVRLPSETDYREHHFVDAKSSPATANHDSTAAIDTDNLTGWLVAADAPEVAVAVFELKEPLTLPSGADIRIQLEYLSAEEQYIAGRIRLSVAGSVEPPSTSPNDNALPDAVYTGLRKRESERTSSESEILAEHHRQRTPLLADLQAKRRRLLDALDEATDNAKVEVMIMGDLIAPRRTYVLNRGQYDSRGAEVHPNTPSFLPAFPSDQPRNRLGLARWLTAENNPLPARVAVNRIWQMHFGEGLVSTPEDFGTQGEMASHPELLDWLASEFINSGWDMKHMHRLIVTSRTYRQSSTIPPNLLSHDPKNRLLARGPRVRLSAQTLRDQALALGGLLVQKTGGRSVKPYQPEGLWAQTAGVNSNTSEYVIDAGSDMHRRSLYTFRKRSVPPPNMILFDASPREVCVVKCPQTNTPLQALTLLNDLTFVEAANGLARRMIAEGGASVDDRIAFAWRAATSQQIDERELQLLVDSYSKHFQYYQGNPESAQLLTQVATPVASKPTDSVELAAYMSIATTILNMDAVITRE